jgi:hypothetical protein
LLRSIGRPVTAGQQYDQTRLRGIEYWPDDVLVCRLGLIERPGEELVWRQDQSVEDFLESLALRLRAANTYPGDEKFSMQAPLASLKKVLTKALEESRSGQSSVMRGIVCYIPNGRWAITQYDVFKVDDIKAGRIGLWKLKEILDKPYDQRDDDIRALFQTDEVPIGKYILTVLSLLFHHKILDSDVSPF